MMRETQKKVVYAQDGFGSRLIVQIELVLEFGTDILGNVSLERSGQLGSGSGTFLISSQWFGLTASPLLQRR